MIKEALRLIRVYHTMKQADLAAKLEISQSHLSEIEKGHKQPTLELLQKYADVFSMPLSSILYFAEHRETGVPAAKPAQTIANKAISMLKWIDEITLDEKSAPTT